MQIISHRLRRPKAALVVIDVQERLLPVIHEKERVVANAVRLVRGMSALGVPIVATEQNPKGLGSTVPEIAGAVPQFAPIAKFAFSACGATSFLDLLAAKNVADVILCGIECHVCVCQTCLDLLDRGFRAFVVADAVSSRTPANHQLGLDRMRASGANIVSTEMVLLELLERADTPEFKPILSLIK